MRPGSTAQKEIESSRGSVALGFIAPFLVVAFVITLRPDLAAAGLQPRRLHVRARVHLVLTRGRANQILRGITSRAHVKHES
jgi:hypothetical protein